MGLGEVPQSDFWCSRYEGDGGSNHGPGNLPARPFVESKRADRLQNPLEKAGGEAPTSLNGFGSRSGPFRPPTSMFFCSGHDFWLRPARIFGSGRDPFWLRQAPFKSPESLLEPPSAQEVESRQSGRSSKLNQRAGHQRMSTNPNRRLGE